MPVLMQMSTLGGRAFTAACGGPVRASERSAMAHGSRCANSVLTPPEKCNCACERTLHGTPHSQRAQAFAVAADHQTDAANRIVTRYRRAIETHAPGTLSMQVTDYVAARLCQESIDGGLELDDLFSSVVDPVLTGLAEGARGGSFKARDRSLIKAVFVDGHIFCVLCVLILQLNNAVEDEADALRDAAVKALVITMFGPPSPTGISDAARHVVTRALTAGINRGLEAVKAATGHASAIQSIELLGLLTCPDIDTHPDDDVYKLCLTPLSTALLSEELNDWIRSLLRDRSIV